MNTSKKWSGLFLRLLISAALGCFSVSAPAQPALDLALADCSKTANVSAEVDLKIFKFGTQVPVNSLISIADCARRIVNKDTFYDSISTTQIGPEHEFIVKENEKISITTCTETKMGDGLYYDVLLAGPKESAAQGLGCHSCCYRNDVENDIFVPSIPGKWVLRVRGKATDGKCDTTVAEVGKFSTGPYCLRLNRIQN